MGIRAELTAGRSQGVGRLQRMPALSPRAAIVALADVGGELTVDRLAGNLGLVLLRVIEWDAPFPLVPFPLVPVPRSHDRTAVGIRAVGQYTYGLRVNIKHTTAV
jgi:hypothetical protein